MIRKLINILIVISEFVCSFAQRIIMRVNISLSEYWLKQMKSAADKDGLSLSYFLKDLYKYVYETRHGLTEKEFEILKAMAEKENRDIKSMITHLLKVDIEQVHYITQFR